MVHRSVTCTAAGHPRLREHDDSWQQEHHLFPFTASSRAQITSVSFINDYSWGGLKADPRDFMRWLFDVHVFLDN